MNSENEKLRGLLQQALDMLEEQALHIEAEMQPAGKKLLNQILAALSQQAEPVEPARPAQTEQKPVGYARKTDLARLMNETMPDGKHVTLGVDHPTCWADEPPYEWLAPIYAAPQSEQVDLSAAMQKAFELGGLEDGSYHLEADELEQVVRAALAAQGGE